MAHNVNFTKSSRKSGSRFTQAKGGASVRVATDNGGRRIGPTHCAASRKHFSTSYGSRKGY